MESKQQVCSTYPAMTDKEYQALLQLYHEYNAAFRALPYSITVMFYERMYAK